MSYQAVIRDASNELVASQVVGMQISILQGSASGSSVYTETQSPTTNTNGLVSIAIGEGSTNDDFSAIDWANGPYFIKTETDPNGASDYTITGTTQLLSVPYAMHAKTAENMFSGDYDSLENKPDLSIYLTRDSVLSEEADGDATNEIQTLSVSVSGDTLYLSKGNYIIIPGISIANGLPEHPTTISVTSITDSSAIIGGTINYNGSLAITSSGVVWDTVSNPTLEINLGVSTNSGSFLSSITGLSASTTYYVRTYATNNAGLVYGNEVSFITTAVGGGGSVTYPEGTVHCNGTPTEVVNVINAITGKTWMDRNLGASQAAISSTDVDAYGDLYQWGRAADGHQCRNFTTTSTLSNTDEPGHGDFIYSTSDWRSPKNDNLWQGVNGTNNPCPSGYRLPTKAELEAEQESWTSDGPWGAFSSSLKLPIAGYNYYSDGPRWTDPYGIYWSSTVDGNRSSILVFDGGNAYVSSSFRADGFSVRCIKD
jgi:uncharacterized protein (TIGR02145 family)